MLVSEFEKPFPGASFFAPARDRFYFVTRGALGEQFGTPFPIGVVSLSTSNLVGWVP